MPMWGRARILVRARLPAITTVSSNIVRASARGPSSDRTARWWRRLRSVRARRSEEHTSELQSLMRISYAVFCLKKKKQMLRLSYIVNTCITLSTLHYSIYHFEHRSLDDI